MKKIFKQLAKILLITVSIALAFLLLLSLVSEYFNPKSYWAISFLGLLFPILLIANFFSLGFWYIFKNKTFFVPLVVLLLSVFKANTVYKFNFKANKPSYSNTKETFKVLTYNVRLMNLYSWINEPNIDKKIIELIQNENADIVCLQEFMYKPQDTSSLRTILLSQKHFKYVHQFTKTKLSGKNEYYIGNITFSKYPIVNKQNIVFENTQNKCMYSDIQTARGLIRIFNTHLQSNSFQQKEYDAISMQSNTLSKDIEGGKSIINKLKNAYVKRSEQVDILLEELSRSPYPVILCGDLNDPPQSQTYGLLTKKLTDTFMDSGKGFGVTYSGKIPLLRIDYIMHSPELVGYSHTVNHNKLSDHYAVSAVIEQ